MKKIEQITHQEQQKLGITFEQAEELLRNQVSCDLVSAKPAPNYDTYQRALEFFQKTEHGPGWTLIEGPQGTSGAFLVCALDKQAIINRIQAKHQPQKEEQPRERARA